MEGKAAMADGNLILEEMRLVEGVQVAVAIKTYPDGKLTGKIRTSTDAPIAEKVAGYFGGGGHQFAAGFRTYGTSYEEPLFTLSTLLFRYLDLPFYAYTIFILFIFYIIISFIQI